MKLMFQFADEDFKTESMIKNLKENKYNWESQKYIWTINKNSNSLKNQIKDIWYENVIGCIQKQND